MRLNQYIARSSELSRRAADEAIAAGRIRVGESPAVIGQAVDPATDQVFLDDILVSPAAATTIMLNKPVGYVCSRKQQGNNPTIYQLLPENYRQLVSVGRLDKESTGLLLLTNDGDLANRLTHPKFGKTKLYLVTVTPKPTADLVDLLNAGVELDDGPSHIQAELAGQTLRLQLSEGRNRQIRRTLDALGYMVRTLHRTKFGELELGDLAEGSFRPVTIAELT